MLKVKNISGLDLYSSFLQKSLDGFTVMTKNSKTLFNLPVNEKLAKEIHTSCVETVKSYSLSLFYTLDIDLNTGVTEFTQHSNKPQKNVEIKIVSKQFANENFDLIYIETASGFHITLDATFIDQVGDFEIKLPTGEVINTKNIN